MEISFFVETDALRTLSPEMSGAEVGILKAFDTARERIHEVAEKVYVRGDKGSFAYILAAADF